MIIYKATNTISGNVYIGQTVKTLEERVHQHTKCIPTGKTKFYKALKSYGVENFMWDIIASAKTKDELNELEIYYIEKYDSIKNGYNLVSGGTGGYNIFAVKANIKKRKGKTWEEIYSINGLEKMKKTAITNGKRFGEYTKKLSKEERIAGAKRANNARTDSGYKHSEETKHRISAAQIGITYEERYDEEKSNELKKLISQKTKEAMKNVDRELLGKKSVENRTPYWNKKHEEQRARIIELQKLGISPKHIMHDLDISYPTYYKRIDELNNF